MSIARLQFALRELPPALREQIVGYARSVDAASPEIAREARVDLTPALRDELTFLAGLRKFYAICAASYWALDNANEFLQARDVGRVRIGSTDFSRGGDLHAELLLTLRDFDRILTEYDITLINERSYADLLSRLADEH